MSIFEDSDKPPVSKPRHSKARRSKKQNKDERDDDEDKDKDDEEEQWVQKKQSSSNKDTLIVSRKRYKDMRGTERMYGELKIKYKDLLMEIQSSNLTPDRDVYNNVLAFA